MSTPDFSDGTMIALQVPPGTASRIAVPGGTPVDEMHCTLAYLGHASQLTEEQKTGIVDAAREAAYDAYPLEGSLPQRVGTFPAGEDGIPYWADPGAPALHNLRENLMRSLSLRGLDSLVSTDHDFNPHVTLDYLPDEASQPDPNTLPQPEPFTFTTLVVKVGPETQTFPLGSPHVDPSAEQDLQPAPVIIPEQPTPLPASARVRITPQVEHSLRRALDEHNSNACLGERTSIEAVRAVYLRGANDPATTSLQASARGSRGTDRVHAFLAGLVASSNRATSQDSDLFPPVPTRSALYEVTRLAESLRAYEVRDVLTASLLHAPSSPTRAFQLNRALALSVTSPNPAVRAGLPARLRALVADGNSAASRSLRAKRQLRDRYGRWIEQGGGIRFKVRQPGAPGGGTWYHGTVLGQDVPNGLVNVQLDDGSKVSVPADKVEQPLAILRTDPRGVGNRPQDKDAPAVPEPEPESANDTGEQPTSEESQAAIDDAGKELAKRIKDDSTEAHHRDTLLEGAQEATANTNSPDELAQHLAQLSEYADNVARGNAGRMTPAEREAFTAYAEDIQDIIAAQRPTVARLDAPGRPAGKGDPLDPDLYRPGKGAPDLPESPPSGKGDPLDPGLAEPVDVDIPSPAAPDAEPVDMSSPDDLLPDIGEYADAAAPLEEALRGIDPDSPARDRVAAVFNVIENSGEDFLGGSLPVDEAMNVLDAAHDELDGVLNDHFDDVSEAEDDINDAMDRISALRNKIQVWNDTPDEPSDSDAPSPAPESSPETPGPVEPATDEEINPPPAPGTPNARTALMNAIEREQEFLDQEPDYEQGQGRGYNGPPDDAVEALDTMRRVLDPENNESPEDQLRMLDMALDDYENALGGEGGAYSLQKAIDNYREAQGLQPPTPDRAPDPWADPAPRAQRTPAPAQPSTPDEPEPDASPDDVADEVDSYTLPHMKDQNGDVVSPGEWVDVGDGTTKGEILQVLEDGVLLRTPSGDEINVRATPAQVRKMSAEEVEALGGDPTGRGIPGPAVPSPEPETPDAPAPPSGETDQFDNPVPARMKLNRETNLPNGNKVQVYNFDDDPNGQSKVDVAVGKAPDGSPRYVVRYRQTARSNHDNWDDAVSAAQQELDRAAPNVEAEAARQRERDAARGRERAQQMINDRRQRENVDDADRPLPEGWSRNTLPGGQPVLVGPGRYRAFTDADGNLHLMARDNQGGFAAVGSFPDWDSLESAMAKDSDRRTHAQRDEAAEWLAGHGFSDETVNAVRTAPSAQAARDAINADPKREEMGRASQDADEVDRRNARQRQAAGDWAALQNHLSNLEDLPGDEAQPDASAPGGVPQGGLSPIQDTLVQNMVNDLESNGDSLEAEALSAAMEGDTALREKLSPDQREAVRDELVGRVQQALENGSISPEDAADLVQRADEFYGEALPPDPNDGLIEPVRAEPQAPAAPPQGPAVPGAPPGQETRYHPAGVIQGRDGNQIAQGARVQARRDGAQGVVVAVQQQPPYARIRFDDGRTLVRAGNQLAVVDAQQPAAPAAPPAPAVPEAPAPAAPNLANAEQLINQVQAIRQGIPTRIGRAGHADASQVQRRNAGFALDDAIQQIQLGNMQEADRHLTRAMARLGSFPEELNQLTQLRRTLRGAPAAPAAPDRPNAGPGNAVPGINPIDWLTPTSSTPGNFGERALSPNAPGVTPAGVQETRIDAAKPDATVDDFQAWGDRAGEITNAARTRAGLEALQNATDYDTQMDAARSIFLADGETTFGNKGYRVKVTTVDDTGNGYSIGFDILDSNGRRIPNAKLTRQIAYDSSKGKWYVYNAYMRFPESHQGGGFANAWNRNVENWAIANGFDRVAVSAGLDKGGLIWSLNGFHWGGNEARAQARTASSQLSRVLRAARGNPAALKQVQQLESRITAAITADDAGLLPTPLELALVGWRPGMKNSEWAGAKGLLGSSWNGVKPLTPDHPIWAQRAQYDKARAASQRVSNNENSIGEVNDQFIRDISQGQYTGLDLFPAQTQELVDVLTNQRSLAALTPETKRKVHSWIVDHMNKYGGDSDYFEDQYRLMRGLVAEQIADAPPGDIGIGSQLKSVRFNDIMRNQVPGWNFENLGAAGGINTTYRATHQASGQQFFIKREHRAVGGAVDRAREDGRNAELDANMLLREAGGGWLGVNEYAPSDVDPDVVIMQRAGDNIDMVQRPNNANSSGALAGPQGLGNLNDPSQVLRMYILDVALGNADRHPGNWQVGKDSQGRFHVFPLDHGLAGGGNDWIAVDNLDVNQRLTAIAAHGAYQSLKKVLEKYQGHSVEYMARQIIKDYQNALGNVSVWYDPEFRDKVGQSLTDLETNIRLLLQKMGK